jgi:chorismate mutase
MNPAVRHQLRHLDAAILALLDERARLLSHVPAHDPLRRAAVDDLLRRHAGPFPVDGIAEVYAAIDRHCAGFARAEAP